MATPEDEVFSSLGLLRLDELLNIYGDLGLPDITDDGDRNVAVVRKRIMKFLTSDAVEKSDDQGLAHFLRIKTYLDTQDIKVSRTDEVPVVPKGVAAVPAVVDNGTESVVKKEPDELTTVSTVSEKTSVVSRPELAELTKYLKKEFKIKGTIRMPDQKDCIKFSALAREINNGLRKKYSEEDIIEEVIRITSPDISLRGLLEGKLDLTLAKLRKLLRVHFHEQGASKLFTELTNAVQTGSQGATEFATDLINLSQRILFVSKEADSEVQFNEGAVKTQLVRSLLSGLRNNNIRNELKPLLTIETDDVDILQLLDKAVTTEEERQAKWGTGKSVAINRVESDVSDIAGSCSKCAGCQSHGRVENQASPVNHGNPSGAKQKNPPRNDHNPIINKLNEMAEAQQVTLNEVSVVKEKLGRVDVLEKEVSELKKELGQKPGKKKFVFGCEACRAAHKAKSCNHCFKCGQEGHKRPDCPN